jgi:hypothetical protein
MGDSTSRKTEFQQDAHYATARFRLAQRLAAHYAENYAKNCASGCAKSFGNPEHDESISRMKFLSERVTS